MIGNIARAARVDPVPTAHRSVVPPRDEAQSAVHFGTTRSLRLAEGGSHTLQRNCRSAASTSLRLQDQGPPINPGCLIELPNDCLSGTPDPRRGTVG